jgi:hypothetical protein
MTPKPGDTTDGWMEVLSAWHDWLKLEMVRQTEDGQACPTLAQMSLTRRDEQIQASREHFIGPSLHHTPAIRLQDLLLRLAGLIGTLRSEMARGQMPVPGRYMPVLVGELCAITALLELVLLGAPPRLFTTPPTKDSKEAV